MDILALISMSHSNKLITEKDGFKYGRMIHPWLFRKTELINDTPSRRDGLSYEEELTNRQRGGVFIHEMVMQLTHGKGEHGLSGVAATLFNRFFKFHSFKRCDYRDVAAACVFLAGKNEDSPKKLKYVVNQLWQAKFPHNKQFPSEQHFMDLCQVVTFLEEIVLRTISFDVNIDLPHQYILKLMSTIEKGRNVYKDMVKTAYYMATDLLTVTDWSIRYSCASIATACVNIAAFFHDVNIDSICPQEHKSTWYRFQDSWLTKSELESMTREFIDLYSRNPQLHIGSLKKIDPNGKVKIVHRSPTQQHNHVSSSSSSSNLKKLDMEAYKERQRGVAVTSTDSPRQSFLPDVKNQKVVEQGLMEQRLQRQQVMDTAQRIQQEAQQRPRSNPSSGHPHQNHRHHHSQQSHHHQHQKPEAPRVAVKRTMGEQHEDLNGTKKTRLDYQMNFVAASSTIPNGHHHQNQHQYIVHQETMNGTTSLPPPPPPPPLMKTFVPAPPHMLQTLNQPPSAYQQMCMDLEAKRRPPSSDSHVQPHHISPPDESSPPVTLQSATMILPPPPPPPVLPPVVRHYADEMEDGELR
ncbi:unnamed protein product [Caenorhabditis sp. 36 PRJEB53466]|nr:unnamed protein product [Caenorhabditis sp. 36 PRJEB53466]